MRLFDHVATGDLLVLDEHAPVLVVPPERPEPDEFQYVGFILWRPRECKPFS